MKQRGEADGYYGEGFTSEESVKVKTSENRIGETTVKESEAVKSSDGDLLRKLGRQLGNHKQKPTAKDHEKSREAANLKKAIQTRQSKMRRGEGLTETHLAAIDQYKSKLAALGYSAQELQQI